jgi:hypothetical protein
MIDDSTFFKGKAANLMQFYGFLHERGLNYSTWVCGIYVLRAIEVEERDSAI